MNNKAVAETLEANMEPAVELLEELIAFPSLRGQEREIGRFLKSRVEGVVDAAEDIPIPDSIQEDPDYSFRLENFSYAGTANLRAKLFGTSRGKTIAFNTHLDVVPPSPGQEEPFVPRRRDGKIYGRGACDAKGQIATLYLVLKTLHDLRLKPHGEIVVDIVVEEECGGNGTLEVVRNGLSADAAVVLEPTDLQVAHLVRGAVWFEIIAAGKAGHSGSPGSTDSALKTAVKAMEAVERVREELLHVSRKAVPKIAGHPNPMPCTFGMFHSGNWPAAAPAEAILKGVFGFLPPFKREDIQAKLTGALRPLSAEVKFNMLRSDSSSIPEDHPLVQTLLEAALEAGISSRAEFMNASCDSWRYSEGLHIPAVVFGPGSIASAHSPKEHIAMEDIRAAALALIYFIHKWSGLDHA
jgi:acetylornithine deacetylase